MERRLERKTRTFQARRDSGRSTGGKAAGGAGVGSASAAVAGLEAISVLAAVAQASRARRPQLRAASDSSSLVARVCSETKESDAQRHAAGLM